MKKALFLAIGLLFFGANAHAANGDIVVNGQIISGAQRGIAPLVVSSTTPVKNLVAETSNNLAMQGETSAKSSSASVSLNLGTVNAGDRIFVQGRSYSMWTALPSIPRFRIRKDPGSTACIVTGKIIP